MKGQKKDCNHWRLVKILGEYQCSECVIPFSACARKEEQKALRKQRLEFKVHLKGFL